MRFFWKLSDQLNKWSDGNEKENLGTTPTPFCAYSSSSEHRARAVAGLSDRALQKMWQTRMQMRQGSRTWAKALFIGQPARSEARNDLRATSICGEGGVLHDGLEGGSRSGRGNLRDQSFALTRAGALKNDRQHRAIHRRRCSGYNHSQHDRELFACWHRTERYSA